jgi:hypothetical protein
MRFYLLFALLILSPSFVFAQMEISGQVLDKETFKPVPCVIVSANSTNNISVTDENGCYSIKIDQPELIYFKQLAYEHYVVWSDSLINNPKVYLDYHIFELSEVIVSPDYAQKILDKAIQNLYNNFLQKQRKDYLLHLDESTTIDGKREAYALFETVTSKFNSKKRISKFDIRLDRLDIIKNSNESSFFVNKKPIWIELFPQNFSIRHSFADLICERHEDKDDLLVLKLSPRYLDKKHFRHYLYTINMQDTTLVELIAQSYPESSKLTLQKYNGTYWQTNNQYFKIKFVQDDNSGLYYIREFTHWADAQIMTDPSYKIDFKINIYEIDSNDSVKTKKKIKPYDYILFENDFPNSPGFWKKYIRP